MTTGGRKITKWEAIQLLMKMLTNNQRRSTLWMKDGTYFCFWKTAELGYNLPKKMLNKIEN